MAAQQILELHLECILEQDTLALASQELSKKEMQSTKWEIIRASPKWTQLEGRMDAVFFEGVREIHDTIPIQLLIRLHGTKYSTNEELASYVNSYYKDLFTLDDTLEECKAARF